MNCRIERGSGTAVRVRVRTAGDICGARSQAAAAVGGADLHPPLLPPQAILCVRWMRVPETIGAADDFAARRRFDRALQVTLDDLARRAVRPADGPIGRCDAVVFGDLAELLACLAQDWFDGRAADRWWWRALLKARVTLDLVVSTWNESGPHIAAAFERLATSAAGPAFISALDHRQVHVLTAAMVHAFGGPSVSELLSARPPLQRMSAGGDGSLAPSISATANATSTIVRASIAAWPSARFRYDQRALVALAVIVRHRPSLLRQPQFGDAFHLTLGLVEASGAGAREDLFRVGRDSDSTPTSVKPGDRSDSTEEMSGAAAPVSTASSRPRELARPMRTGAGDRAAVDTIVVHDARRTAGQDESRQAQPSPPPGRGSGLESMASAAPVEISLGGIFYLLNVAIALRLYGDFTRPQRPGLMLSPWDFLPLVAEYWLGEALDESTNALLARLAGRAPGDRPGAGLYSHERLARWVPRIVRRINVRVARSLGEPADANLGPRLLRHHARVHVSAAHVDVMFDLGALPIELRLAGLDRDPGWIPAAGRIVSFHYS